MTITEIKSLPRTADGLFDLSGICDNVYKAAAQVYPVYAGFETTENKKEGYPDIMAQMRLWNRKVNQEFSFANAADYLSMVYGTLENMSPEIYENYRELLDMFRTTVKMVLQKYYIEEKGAFAEGGEAEKTFCDIVQKACNKDLLLAEKYEMCL